MWFSSVSKEDLQSYLLIHARHERAYWLASDLFAEVNSVSSKFKKNNSFREKQEKEIHRLLENEKQIVRLGNITQPIARLTQDHVLRSVHLYELAADQALVGREVITREDSNLVSYEGMLDAEVKYIDQYLDLIGMDTPESIDAKGMKELEQGLAQIGFYGNIENLLPAAKMGFSHFYESYETYRTNREFIEAYAAELSNKLDFKDDSSKKTFKDQVNNHWKKILSCGSRMALAAYKYSNSLIQFELEREEYDSSSEELFLETIERLGTKREEHLLALQKLILDSISFI